MNKAFDHTRGAYLDCNDAKIYYEITGNENGPVLLLLHGGFGDLDDFRVILPELSEHFKSSVLTARTWKINFSLNALNL